MKPAQRLWDLYKMPNSSGTGAEFYTVCHTAPLAHEVTALVVSPGEGRSCSQLGLLETPVVPATRRLRLEGCLSMGVEGKP